ncbi:MAG: Stf0 family sulfotransferase [Alterinioella nitratireducens]|uniref:Stf0 family sulfotransferase n=1 Tax=Alterinioella nitratireducens TaxID=2735915 RepID=UPI00405895B7
MNENLFEEITETPERFARIMARRPADIRYVIYFTPRTGSSWLTDVATGTGRLSKPGECFNPNFVPKIAQSFGATSLDDYVAALLRTRNTDGVFGCQLTYYQLRHTFGEVARFMRHFEQSPCFWLIREDIVLQAVSLMKKAQTKIAHKTQADPDKLHRAEDLFQYDDAQIHLWIKHVRQAEIGTEAVFQSHGLTPLRLSYEIITALGAADLIKVIATHIGADGVETGPSESGHAKIGTDKNAAFADRFRSENRPFITKLEAERAPMLERLNRTLPRGP